MKKMYVIFVLTLLIGSSIIITNNLVPSITKATTPDYYPPRISAASASPQTVGFGFNVTINPTVTDNISGVHLVKVNITYPNHTHTNLSTSNKGTSYQCIFPDTWEHGRYNYTIWATDNANNTNTTTRCFNVTAFASLSIATLKDNYTENQTVNLTDPPNPQVDLTLVNQGSTWNIYYNATTGDNTLETYQEPINYQDTNGTWTPINTTLTPTPQGSLAYINGYTQGNDQGPYAAYFKTNTQDTWPIAFAYNRSTDPTTMVIRTKLTTIGYIDPTTWTTHILQNTQNSNGQFNGNNATYPGVFTGTDLTYTYQNTQLKEAITLTNTTKTALLSHPPSQYGLGPNTYLVFATKIDSLSLTPYDGQNPITGNYTVTQGITYRDALNRFACAFPIGTAYEQNNTSAIAPLIYRLVHQGGDTYLLSGVPYTTLTAMTFPVVIDPTITTTSLASDGFIYNSGTSYSTVRTATSGTVNSTATSITIGQKKVSSTYYIYRGFVIFNTTTLPSNAYIDNATLSLYKVSDFSTTDFSITIQNGQSTYPHTPMQASDYNKNDYAGNGGTLNTTLFTTGYNPINITNLNWITKNGTTKLCLRSSRDINGNTPTGNEYITVGSHEYNGGLTGQPKLVINYRNQSKIKDTGTTNIKGYLLIQIQYLYEGSWYVADDAINETSPRTITTGNQLPLDTIFNDLVNTKDLPFGNGTYRVYAVFRDPYGLPLMCNNNQILVGIHEFHLHGYYHGWHRLLVQDGFWKGSIWTSHNVATRGMAIYKGELYVGTENLNKWKWDFLHLFNGFSVGTHIAMADGSYQNIEDIQSGDKVKAYDMGTHEYVNATVQAVYQHTYEESPGYILKFNSNVSSSPNQVFLVNGVLKEARTIEIGDNLTDGQGENSTITSIDNITALENNDIYNFMIGASPNDTLLEPNNLTFFAEGITAYPWGPDGANDYNGEAEAYGVDLTDDIMTGVSEAIFKLRADASDGCEIWKYNQSTNHWTSVIFGTEGDSSTRSGFGDTTNWGAGEIKEFHGDLFVGTWSSPMNGKGLEIWRYNGSTSTWTNIVGRSHPNSYYSGGFHNWHNCAVTSMAVFKDRLYVGTMNWDSSDDGRCQVWRTTNYNGSEWEQVVDLGFRDGSGAGSTAQNAYAWRMTEFQGELYVGTYNVQFPVIGEKGCELFRSGSGDANDWHMLDLPNGNGFHTVISGGRLYYGIRGLQNWNDQYLYVGLVASFLQLSGLFKTPKALEIWRFDNSSPTTNWQCVVGNVEQYPPPLATDGFDNHYNKYPWSMAICGNKLWIGTLNTQFLGNPSSYGCEVWNYDGSTLTPSVKNDLGEKPNGFGHDYDIAARSMIEFPEGSGRLVVGTVSLQAQFRPLVPEYGCEIWFYQP